MITFERWFLDNVPSEHFKPHELLFRGASNMNRNSPAFNLNTDPPLELWPNCKELVRVLDAIRTRAGSPVMLISIYRSPEYNRAVGGATHSMHRKFKAADIVSGVSPSAIHKIATQLRAEGFFKGGIGKYRGFTHVDVRGNNVDW